MAIVKYRMQNPVSPQEKLALEALYNSTDGINWKTNTSWLSGNVSNWFGVTVSNSKVTAVQLPDNNLTGTIPDDILDLDALTSLDVSKNNLTAIPDFTSLTSLATLNISENKLDFSSLLPNAGMSGINYTPQDSVEIKENVLRQISETINFNATIGGAGNTYQWMKNAAAITGATSPTLTLNNITFKDEGVYTYAATNPGVPGLTLHSRNKILRVSSLERDSIALRFLYFSTDGPNWSNNSNWLTSPLGTGNWYGVTIGNNRVTALDLSSNNLNGKVPAALTDIQNLTSLNLSSNKITHLPDLKPLTGIATLDVSKNQLDFASLIANSSITGVNYMEQSEIGVPGKELVDVGSSYLFKVSTKGAGNQYQWKRNGISVEGAQDSIYVINSLDRTNMGEYVSEITNPLVPGLMLRSAAKNVLAVASVSGKLKINEASPATKGTVTLLRIEAVGGYDTLEIKNISEAGEYRFDRVILDNYQIVGFADTVTHVGALPTYYKNTYLWEEADDIFLEGNRIDMDIMSAFKPTEPPKGNGVLSGYFEEDEQNGGKIEAAKRVNGAGASVRRVENAAKPMEVQLTLVAYVFTNEEGEFVIPDLPKGEYRFNIQYPGYPMDETTYTTIIIGDGLESQVRVAARVEDNKIKVNKLVVTGVWEEPGYFVSVHPNPVPQVIHLNFESESAYRSVQLLDRLGRSVKEQKAGAKYAEVNVEGMSSGIYFLKIIENNRAMKVIKIAIER